MPRIFTAGHDELKLVDELIRRHVDPQERGDEQADRQHRDFPLAGEHRPAATAACLVRAGEELHRVLAERAGDE